MRLRRENNSTNPHSIRTMGNSSSFQKPWVERASMSLRCMAIESTTASTEDTVLSQESKVESLKVDEQPQPHPSPYIAYANEIKPYISDDAATPYKHFLARFPGTWSQTTLLNVLSVLRRIQAYVDTRYAPQE
jgi:hypothetical protein